MGKSDKLTTKEKLFIRENFGKMTIAEIATSIGRAYATVQKELSSSGHHRTHKWTEADDFILISLWGKYPAGYIAPRIGVDENCIYNRVRRLQKQGKIERKK